MTLEEAQEVLANSQVLIGSKHGKSIITHIAILPHGRENLGEIVKQVLWDEPYGHLLAGHNNFNVIALMDLEYYPDSGILFYEEVGRF